MRRHVDLVSTALYLAFVTVGVVVAFARPAYNWDVLGYVGAALSLSEDDPRALHATTYGEVRRIAPQTAYDRLVDSASRRSIEASPAEFVKELPLYRARILYVLFVRLLHEAGVAAATATVAVSAVASWVTCVLIFVWMRRHASGVASAVLSGCMAIGVGCFGLARLSTPDALSMAFVMSAAYLLFEGERALPAAAMAVASILVRPDNLAFAIVLLAYLAVRGASRPIGRTWIVVFFFVALFAYLAVERLSGQRGWETVFYRNLVQTDQPVATVEPIVSMGDYLRALARGTRDSALNPQLGLFTLLGALAWGAGRNGPRSRRLLDAIAVVAVATLLRFLLFPVPWNRVLAGSYAVVGAASLVLLWQRVRPEFLGRT